MAVVHHPEVSIMVFETIKQIIAEAGATSMMDMGKVMGIASKALSGKAEGRAISAKVKELLG